MRTKVILAIVVLLLPLAAAAVSVTTPQGPREVFARGDLLDVLALLRLAGAEVQFAAAAGSYAAAAGTHEVQFTPGGSLAVVDGQLAPLPGPLRVVESHVVGSLATASALLEPFGWAVRGSAAAPELVKVGGVEILTLSVVRAPTGTTVVVRGTAQRPRVVAATGAVNLLFPSAVQLARPVAPEGELLGGELHEGTLTLRLAPGTEVAASYSLDDPPRFVLRLATATAVAPLPTPSAGPLVVLDPGHGGDDQGAKGPNGELEKDITLAVARATGVTVRLTRDGDEAVALTDRTALANRLQAAVFLSIHANSSPARGAHGAETYYMSVDASDPQAAQAAARENASAPPNTLQLILWDLAHVANLNSSARLARTIQERLDALQGIRDRGIRQAPFVVLTGATMPAALVEVGFLSNAGEATRLLAPDTQGQIAAALAEAVVSYLRAPTPVPDATVTPTP
jgi:N-acetylmuramoyl-L-alanine amidase